MTSARPAPQPDSSRDRILAAARQLFAERGYENTSTLAVAREAKSSESQLIKHFGSKEGLLESIFDEGWAKMAPVFQAVDVVQAPIDKLRMLLDLFLRAFEQDPTLKELMMLESRRIRKDSHSIMQTKGYGQFIGLVDSILGGMAKRGELKPGLSGEIVRAALMGMLEGMLREQVLLARHAEAAANVSTDHIRKAFACTLDGFLAHPAK